MKKKSLFAGTDPFALFTFMSGHVRYRVAAKDYSGF